jgi:serine phosphatase RsbU (regulator of sigma subunit)
MNAKTRRSAGLVLKFSMLMIVLVILIVAGVAVPLSLQMRTREQRMLADGLRNRAGILLESVASRAAEPVRAGVSGYAAVSAFPAEISAMPGEALSLTISGPGDPERPGAPEAEDPLDRDYLWATNDPSLAAESFEPARQKVPDVRLDGERVMELARSVNTAAAEKLRGLSDDAASIEKALQEVAADEGSSHTGSVPPFDPDRLESKYLFYRPLVTGDPEGAFFSGLVRLTVSTDTVSAQVNNAVQTMVTWAGVVALIAVAVGVVGAILLASIAIRPIRRLVKQVSDIRDIEDKAQLKEIPVGARDEIGMLAETVNEMTEGLVSAAIAEKEMLVGRAIQKQFLPLEPGTGGEKGSTGGVKNADIDLYAFYEGAAKVSGDYFDWQKLDDRHYAIMKCDVSGHGVEAAFIMVEVATLFLRWCREWTVRLPAIQDTKERERVRQELLRLDKLVYTINDMIEERGFGGKFAAFMLCLYDVRTGLVTACSAGDNVLYRFDAASRSLVTREIKPESPAVGQFASDLIVSSSGYPSVQMQLNPNDVLVLFTDGFEESRRHFRDGAGLLTACTEPKHKKDNKQDPFMQTHTTGEDFEEMSVPRILGTFNAFFNRTTYRLERHHLAQPEDLEFDFSGCSDSLEEAVLALVSVERVYRTYRDPQTGPKDRISLESKVDQYLRKHFKQYEKTFVPQETGQQSTEYVSLSSIKEDIQVDDLTVVLLRRP